MEMKRRIRTLSGTKDQEISKREQTNRKVSRKAACEGIVLMKNEGVLPLDKSCPLALFGSGAGRTIKGGTGSGDVCERASVSIYEGLLNEGITVTSEKWIQDYERIFKEARENWKQEILSLAGGAETNTFFQIYADHAFEMPSGRKIEKADIGEAKKAIYVISRIAGEGADRRAERGDYYLTEHEKEDLMILSQSCEHVIVIINTGGQIDLEEILQIKHMDAILYMAQAGMEGGNALAEILTGKVTPSGKLVDTWAKKYEDFPNAATFSHNNKNVQEEFYEEGIYVGYRYFDSFKVEPQYAFGYGLSYTDFSMETDEIFVSDAAVTVKVTVTNIGKQYAGKEVVQIYAACPQEQTPKEWKRLCGFAKTKHLLPGEKEQLTISFGAEHLTSFDEERSAWVLEKGTYMLFVGNASDHVTAAAVLEVGEDVIWESVPHICPLEKELTELMRPDDLIGEMEQEWRKNAKEKNIPSVVFCPAAPKKGRIEENEFGKMASELVKKLTDEELIAMVIGEVSRGHNQALGAAGIMVPGAAGETSGILEEKWDVPGIAMADGPAGLRLIMKYQADKDTKEIYTHGFLEAMERGIFAKKKEYENADTYYQYCTAMPVGVLLSQTWNMDLLKEVGRAVAVEMAEFGIAWWLAPGMNIHRNPLCGRNFEYYSEDPLLSGCAAAAITLGVQSIPGTGTTIKHFACNNQEDNRIGSDSILSERTLREIYLRGFEIAVKTAQPMAIMTSYNMINGVHSANCRDICMVAAREEWDFQGIIMTDWTTTSKEGGSLPWKCVAAGNDLIMPGAVEDSENIREALKNGTLTRKELESCVARLLKVISQTLGYESCVSYYENIQR